MNSGNPWGQNTQFGGLPAHMDDNQPIVLRKELKQKQ